MTVLLPPEIWLHVGLLLQVRLWRLFVKSLTSAAPWIACKSAFIQNPPHGKPLRAASAIGTLTQSLSGKLIGTKLPFQMNQVSVCGTMMSAFVLDAMPVNTDFQSALSNDIVS
ncbi:hypothetical protein TNCV_4212141 [Trichonephila clavipes]|nr:hypothetical protein TNCV_4212141 [Trichonephila clavipes]